MSRLELSAGYWIFSSPNNSFSVIRELSFGLSYDDKDHWYLQGFGGVQPSFEIAIETQGASDGEDQGIFLGLGAEPRWSLAEEPWPLSFPMSLGLSVRDY